MAVTVVDYPATLPAKCASCGNPYPNDGRKYVDMHIDVERYGRVYICTLCFGEAARYMDYAPYSNLVKKQARIVELEAALEGAGEENAELRDALGSLGILGIVVEGDNPIEKRLERIEEFVRAIAIHPIFSERQPDSNLPNGKPNTQGGKLGLVEPSKGIGLVGVPADVEVGNDTA